MSQNNTTPLHATSQSDVDEIENLIHASVRFGPMTVSPARPPSPPRASIPVSTSPFMASSNIPSAYQKPPPIPVPPPQPADPRQNIAANGFGSASNTLTEPVWDTVKRDMSRIVSNLKLVVFPNPNREDPGKALRDWDLWGPFFFIIFLGLVLSWSATVKKSEVFAVAFAVLAAGAVVLTLNVVLLGGQIIIFQSLSLLGYMESYKTEPLLSSWAIEDGDQVEILKTSFPTTLGSFTKDGDREHIRGVRDFCREFCVESKKLWYLAGPAIFTSICQYSLGAITQLFAGHVGTLELAAVSIENSVIAGFSLGIMLGMGSALETLCGQAYGAGQIDMLGVYMQRSWVILNSTAIILSFLYIFATQLLELIGQDTQIAKSAGTFALWMIPQLFAYSMNFPIAKFLQAQSKMMVMAAISLMALVLHTFFSWLLIMKLGWGLVGAAVVLNTSWWFIVMAQLVYIFSGTCGRAWSGFSWKAFSNLWGFLRLSLASAVMLCLEIWYFTALVLFAGYLKNPEVSVDALSVCMNIFGWTVMVAIGANAAISVRVSNELGANHPRIAKFSVVVVVITSFAIGVLLSLILIITRKQYPSAFTSNEDVKKLVYLLTPLLASSIIINNVQPVLSGVAIGAGWQAAVAYVNIGCYYICGIPLGLILGYKIDLGVSGIWYGMLSGTVLQTFVLFWMIYRTNWNKEASIAGDRIKSWGGNLNDEENEAEK